MLAKKTPRPRAVKSATKMRGGQTGVKPPKTSLFALLVEKCADLRMVIFAMSAPDVRQLYRKASGGDPYAQYEYGLLHTTGTHVPRDPVTAAQWLGKAAEAGVADAQFVLGALFEKGQGVSQDQSKAIQWYKRAAKMGHVGAQFNLGFCYETGAGVQKDIPTALAWYRMSAENGDEDAKEAIKELAGPDFDFASQPVVAVLEEPQPVDINDPLVQYQTGLHLAAVSNPPNYTEAVRWLRMSAYQNFAEAQFTLGSLYDRGQGVERDVAQAAQWYLAAARNGHSKAQYNVGCAYETGEGVDPDVDEAIHWYRRAADQGNTDAIDALAALSAQRAASRVLSAPSAEVPPVVEPRFDPAILRNAVAENGRNGHSHLETAAATPAPAEATIAAAMPVPEEEPILVLAEASDTQAIGQPAESLPADLQASLVAVPAESVNSKLIPVLADTTAIENPIVALPVETTSVEPAGNIIVAAAFNLAPAEVSTPNKDLAIVPEPAPEAPTENFLADSTVVELPPQLSQPAKTPVVESAVIVGSAPAEAPEATVAPIEESAPVVTPLAAPITETVVPASAVSETSIAPSQPVEAPAAEPVVTSSESVPAPQPVVETRAESLPVVAPSETVPVAIASAIPVISEPVVAQQPAAVKPEAVKAPVTLAGRLASLPEPKSNSIAPTLPADKTPVAESMAISSKIETIP
ncbi:MAG TPA: hypothetical protein VHH73_01120, partial [Verrucomicrobiae bacterium]|nr:hypothetical protein [Verrucomicrobiae bacterium]